MCILSQVLLLVWCSGKPRKIAASGPTMEGDGLRSGGVVGWTLIVVVGMALRLLLMAIVNFSHQLGYLFFLIIGFFVAFSLWVFSVVTIIIGSVKALNGEIYKYPLTIEFVK